ncbi:MAG: putative zinc-binding metallopeptidase [Gemmataceae bacterium]
MSFAVNPPTPSFRESRLGSTPIRDLGLTIEGTPLEPAIAEVRRELEAAGIRKLRPHFYLTTEWVVYDDTIAVGIPFYLARPDLTEVHAEREGHLEGVGRAELLRYLRHEVGHVVNYAYRLFDREDWVRLFGSMTQPYIDEYRPEPFSRRYVVHLPGWYAQKHPDEDWAETFAVWLTPAFDWRAAYADWPMALAKLDYCDRLMRQLGDQEPAVTALDLEAEVGNLSYPLADYYEGDADAEAVSVPGLDGAVRTIFEALGEPEDATTRAERLPAANLIRRWERTLMADVYRWTGHFPERTRALLRHLAERATALQQVYPADREAQAVAAVATLVTALAMNHVHRGTYAPDHPLHSSSQ